MNSLISYSADTRRISTTIERCLKRAGVVESLTMTEVPSMAFKRQLVRNRLYNRLRSTKKVQNMPQR
ncbi:hypothetical protein KIN20_000323 [Parelaphostrongylus tenuis]|uniref:Uncharacterized protein n=1 Tax=Parelaphostrongylus tenuis TaxID=148309 RepID=A0AAD5MB58_PARTN|nr:hypothetical protein KIN20_000323 [Parelaphostrongylus tenuis]